MREEINLRSILDRRVYDRPLDRKVQKSSNSNLRGQLKNKKKFSKNDLDEIYYQCIS